MALSTVWVMAASILSTFDILKPLDDDGSAIEPTIEFSSSPVLYAMLWFFLSYILLTLRGSKGNQSRSSADSDHAMEELKH